MRSTPRHAVLAVLAGLLLFFAGVVPDVASLQVIYGCMLGSGLVPGGSVAPGPGRRITGLGVTAALDTSPTIIIIATEIRGGGRPGIKAIIRLVT